MGGEGTRLRPLTAHRPQADAPDRGAAHDRAGARPPGRPWDRRGRAVPRLPARRLHRRLPRRGHRRGPPRPTPSSPAPRHRRGHPVRRPAGRASTRPSWWSTGTCSPTWTSSGLVAFHRDRGAEATIGLTPVDDPSAFGVVPTDDDGRVQAFIEKPPRDEAPTNLINAGTYVFEPSVLDRIAAEAPGLHRAGDLPRPGRPRAPCSPRARTPTGWTPAPRRLPAGPPRPDPGAPARDLRLPGRCSIRPSAPGCGGSVRSRCRGRGDPIAPGRGDRRWRPGRPWTSR